MTGKNNSLYRKLNQIIFSKFNSLIYHHYLLKVHLVIYKYFLNKSKILISILLEKLSDRMVLLKLLILSKTKKSKQKICLLKIKVLNLLFCNP